MRSGGLAVEPLAVLLKVDIGSKAISRADEAEAGTMATVTANRKHFANYDCGFVGKTVLIVTHFVDAGLWGHIPGLEDSVIHSCNLSQQEISNS
jgi:hypothetical protein